MGMRRGGKTTTAAKKAGQSTHGVTLGGFAVKTGNVIKEKAARAAGAGKTVTIVTENNLAGLVMAKRRKSGIPVLNAEVIRRAAESTTRTTVADAGVKVRKNMHIEQALLDRAREATGARSETETVHLAWAETVKVAAFRQALLDGYEAMATSAWFDHADHDDVPSRPRR